MLLIKRNFKSFRSKLFTLFNMKTYLILCVLCSVYAESIKFTGEQVNWRAEKDRITQLPGLEGRMPNFKMYSGYLDISETRHLHYWLNECENENSDKLIIWFNGGPGCSSMDGLLHENGPYKLGPTGNLEANPYSWNKLAHTVYIEAPVGVGFSFTTEEDPLISDDTVARDNLAALIKLFVKFPQYEYHDLYITGESFAGIYVPTLVTEIINHHPEMARRIRGIAIGNGLMNKDINDDSLIYYAYYHGLFGTIVWNELLHYCCHGSKCDFAKYQGHDCSEKVSWFRHQIHNGGLNLYNLYQSCTPDEVNPEQPFNLKQAGLDQKPSSDNVVAMEKFNAKLSLVPKCSNATFITRYLNRRDVQSAIHVEQMRWEVCNDEVLTNYEYRYADMSPQIRYILSSLEDVSILLYFGDVDLACNYMGGEWFVDQLGFTIVISRRVWLVEDENGNLQIAGYFKEFHRLIFATVKGAGHMVPMDKPKESYVMLERFLQDMIL